MTARTTATTAAALACVVALAPDLARADHGMHDMAMADGKSADGSELSAGLSVQAAQFDNMLYEGSYQAVMPSLGWMRGRFGAGATVGLYHLTKNGLSIYGLGDAMFTGHVAVWSNDDFETGFAMHVMLPSGSELDGFGMGHTMAMPSAWGTWHARRVTVMASAGYSRALTSLAGGGHNHGPSPLVDPMNMNELTWSTGADVDVSHGVRVGGRALGGFAIGTGSDRVIGAGHVAWGTARFSTGFELQLGLAGDPFSVRGVVDTALRF